MSSKACIPASQVPLPGRGTLTCIPFYMLLKISRLKTRPPPLRTMVPWLLPYSAELPFSIGTNKETATNASPAVTSWLIWPCFQPSCSNMHTLDASESHRWDVPTWWRLFLNMAYSEDEFDDYVGDSDDDGSNESPGPSSTSTSWNSVQPRPSSTFRPPIWIE